MRSGERARRVVLLAMTALTLACRSHLPAWTEIPATSNSGESTLTGSPLTLTKTETPPVLDGKLDDGAWARAAILGPLVDPGTGADARSSRISTFAKITWDERALYLGIVVRDQKASSPFSRDEIDPHIWSKASGVELMLQPGDPGDNRDYYELQVDVNGAVWDTRFDDYNRPITGEGATKQFGHQDWQSHVERAVFVEPSRFYCIELALPWSSLSSTRTASPPHAHDVWRANLYSFRDGQRQALAWSPLKGEGNFHKASRFGRLKF